jgi:hypothetical protein
VLVNKKLMIFQKKLRDVKNIKCPLEWCRKHKSMFPTIGFLAKQILGIISFQIKIERMFSLLVYLPIW